MTDRLKGCDNPACGRLTSSGSMFCCAGCDRANGKYDPDGYHSVGCEERWAARLGVTFCNHTIEEGCTGHGDF